MSRFVRLTNSHNSGILGPTGRSAVRIARTVWVREVPGSNPGAPTEENVRALHKGSVSAFQADGTGSIPVARSYPQSVLHSDRARSSAVRAAGS